MSISQPEWILGLGGSDHEFSAVLAKGADIRVAIEEERLSRRKHGYSLWYEQPVKRSMQYCLAVEHLNVKDIGRIVSSDILPIRLRDELRGYDLHLYPHHLCHAAAAYLMVPSNARAGVIVYDGYGSVVESLSGDPFRNRRETISLFEFGPEGFESIGQTTGISIIEQDDFPTGVSNSLGMLYELVTGTLGFDVMDSGKTMGLSAFGQARYLETFRQFVKCRESRSNSLTCNSDDPGLRDALENILEAGRFGFGVKADIAASVQHVVNEALAHFGAFFRSRSIDYLCVSGGCALNTVANSFLVDHAPREVPVIIPPFASDAGVGFGALWLDIFKSTGTPPPITFNGLPAHPNLARPGRLYSRDELRAATQEFYPRLSLDPSVMDASSLAQALSQGAVVGLFNGRSEIGPRALGGRSILADARSSQTREKLNRTIKQREPFRPLAPMILREDFDEYFIDQRHADPFMLKIARARARCVKEAPAVVHVDGTARVQVIEKDGDPFLVALLQAFRHITGVGVILNTSFNRRGEPIVESPLDAIDAFLGMKLDGLYMDGEFYRPATMPA